MKNRGFTLIELFIVILTIGILMTIAFPRYRLIKEKAKVANAISDLNMILKAEAIYRVEEGFYTDNFMNLVYKVEQIEALDWYSPNKKFFWYDIQLGIDRFTATATRADGLFRGMRIQVNDRNVFTFDFPFDEWFER